MLQNPNKLLIALLVLLIGVVPIGSVIASPHSCAPGSGQSAVTEGTGHADLGHLKVTGDTRVDLPSNQDCNGCDKDCCQGGVCKMGHCVGAAVVLQTSIMLEFERFVTSETTLTGDRPLAGRLTPPFRPPQA